ncbi:MAG: proline dehydrogenase family protein [Pyrinomonadaceae bacterium]|nr:proline dehydrogenase family protein [Pyrinomonadaceae bacterium]
MRFIGGETLAQCVEVAKSLTQQGLASTIDYMGESTRNASMAEQAKQEFLEVIQVIAKEDLDSSVSLDLSHIGMVVDAELGYKNAHVLAEATHKVGLEMMISMEGTDRTSLILDIYRRLCEHFDNVGITLQAYLYRTPDDLRAVVKYSGKIRLVKGAFDVPKHLAVSRGAELDTAYCRLMESLLKAGHLCSIATHDESILNHAHEFIQERKIKQKNVEFELLKGVTPNLLQNIHERGYRTRVYLPYGREWYLYLCNRLSEHPPNVYQAITDAVEHRHES